MLQNRREELLTRFQSSHPEKAGRARAVFERFDQRAERKGYASHLQEALRRGGSRKPKEHQVLMHISSPLVSEEWLRTRIDKNYNAGLFSDEQIFSSIHEYRSRLMQCVQDHSSIHIESSFEYPIFQIQQSRRRCESLSSDGVDTGYLSEEEILRFLEHTEGIHSDDTFIIHGAYVGACIDHFALQICALKLFQQYQVANIANNDLNSSLLTDEENAMYEFDRVLRMPRLARVQHGTVYDLYNIRGVFKAQENIDALKGESTLILP